MSSLKSEKKVYPEGNEEAGDHEKVTNCFILFLNQSRSTREKKKTITRATSNRLQLMATTIMCASIYNLHAMFAKRKSFKCSDLAWTVSLSLDLRELFGTGRFILRGSTRNNGSFEINTVRGTLS